jgi:hypothetical protein
MYVKMSLEGYVAGNGTDSVGTDSNERSGFDLGLNFQNIRKAQPVRRPGSTPNGVIRTFREISTSPMKSG